MARNESVKIEFPSMSAKDVKRHRKLLTEIGYGSVSMEGADTMVPSYTFNMQYFGDAEKKLRAVIRLQRAIGKGKRTGTIKSDRSVMLQIMKHIKEIQV